MLTNLFTAEETEAQGPEVRGFQLCYVGIIRGALRLNIVMSGPSPRSIKPDVLNMCLETSISFPVPSGSDGQPGLGNIAASSH